mmetsp:Transcript_69253/g.178485  ORF Transcript_69253/g.178485 Transcript_69253/m.178485 type:complete len:224 (+) Transcript_69253:149-820(+)
MLQHATLFQVRACGKGPPRCHSLGLSCGRPVQETREGKQLRPAEGLLRCRSVSSQDEACCGRPGGGDVAGAVCRRAVLVPADGKRTARYRPGGGSDTSGLGSSVHPASSFPSDKGVSACSDSGETERVGKAASRGDIGVAVEPGLSGVGLAPAGACPELGVDNNSPVELCISAEGPTARAAMRAAVACAAAACAASNGSGRKSGKATEGSCAPLRSALLSRCL